MVPPLGQNVHFANYESNRGMNSSHADGHTCMLCTALLAVKTLGEFSLLKPIQTRIEWESFRKLSTSQSRNRCVTDVKLYVEKNTMLLLSLIHI